jgi:hypothetical protein
MYRIRGGLDRLDHAGDFALLERRADGGQIDEDHVAQRVLRVVGDADGGGLVVFDVDPLVVVRVHRRHGCAPLGRLVMIRW